MLKSLYIKNVAIITSCTLEFDEGLNILSGETGAGKSIIIDSLDFVLGGKADKSLVRYGEESMSVEALFSVNAAVGAALAELGFEEDEDVVLSRALSASGRSDIRVNGRPTTLSVLKSLTQSLCDIYGQSEHISLLRTASHRRLVDAFAGAPVAAEKDRLAALLERLHALRAEMDSLGGNPEERARLLDLYAYQIREIEEAALGEHEEEELENRRRMLAHAEKIADALKDAVSSLTAGEYGANDQISRALGELRGVVKYDDRLDSVLPRLEAVKYECEDLADTLKQLLDGLSFDEGEADRVFERMDKIKSLHKKYGADYAAVTAYCRRAKEQFAALSSAEERLEECEREKGKLLRDMKAVCARLTALRRESADRLEARLNAEFTDLALKHAKLKVEFGEPPAAEAFESRVGPEGVDEVRFLFSANAGEPLKPLEKVISGGEMSRVMLAVKQVTADLDDIGTQIFDEVDAGISGETSLEVAKKIAAIARHRQVISITHTAGIVAVADRNFFIEKRVAEDKTSTAVRILDADGRVREVARLLGAVEHNEFGVKHAEELLAWGEAQKTALRA